MSSWREVLQTKPVEALLAFGGLAVVTVVAALVLRRLLRRATSLRHVVLAVAMSALGLGVLAALLAARLMLLDAAQAWTFVSVLAMAAGFSALLALLVAQPLGDDVRRLEEMVRRVEAGDRKVRSGVRRADELGHVSRALDDLVGRLDLLESERDAVDRERRVLLSSIGHDLRTPLAALRAAVEALADGVAPDPARYLQAMEHDIAALTQLVDDLFLMSRLDAGTVQLERHPVALTELAEETVTALAPVAAARHIDLQLRTVPDDVAFPSVMGDASALARVVRNLIDNALRHAPEQSQVQVTLSDDRERDGIESITVRVRDEGPGFPPDFRRRAFTPLSRADAARTRSTGGSGLGLAIAQGIISAHGGEIWIEPTGADPTSEGAGAEVAFRLHCVV